MDRKHSRRQVKKRKLPNPQPDDKGQPRTLYGINVNNFEWMDTIRECPVYQPSRKDFVDPFAYLQKISPQASKFGICKIVCPFSDTVPALAVLKKDFQFGTCVQPLKYGTWEDEKLSYNQGGRLYNYKEFERKAKRVLVEKFSSSVCLPCKKLEREFWQEMVWGEYGTVEYGVNVEGSVFSNNDELGRSKWNLKVLPHLPESILRHEKKIPGITDPMLYFGMVFSTFAWHVEDHYLYSINYLHSGAPKTWYGVPGSRARNFEGVVFDNVYSKHVMTSYESDAAAQVLSEKTTMLPPSLFMKHNVPVFKVVQMPGEFVITFPRSYHAGFSHGFNCAEAVNFAVGDWFTYGSIAAKRYSYLETLPLISFEQLLCTEALLLCDQMRSSETSTALLSSQDYSSQCSIMVCCIAYIGYHRAALRKLEQHYELFLERRTNTIGTIICDYCAKDRYLAFIMCHRCKSRPTCVYHGVSVFCNECNEEGSLYMSDDMRCMEAAADYFEGKEAFLSSYLYDTQDLLQEIEGLYECERDDWKEASTSAMDDWKEDAWKETSTSGTARD